MLKHTAFTLIELVFAIVIIAISVLSIPMITQVTSKGIERNIVQEVIFATGTILTESTTYYWDLHSLDDANTTSNGYSRVVNAGSCQAVGADYKRIGHINRQCLDDNTTSPDNIGDFTSIEWASTVYNNLDILTGNPNAATYKDNYNATVNVTHCATGLCTQFGQEINNSNLKEIEISIIGTWSSDILVRLRTYTANIGEVKPASKVF